LFTSEDSANLLQATPLFVGLTDMPPRINRKADGSRVTQKSGNNCGSKNVMIKKNHLLLLCHTQKHFATTFIGIM
jgi:hypothetical protein